MQFTSANSGSDCNWSYTASYTDLGTAKTAEVVVQGGIHAGWDSSDPYLLDDRGLWFDGKYDFLLINNMTIRPLFGFSMWIRPQGSGTLYSVSRLNDPEKEDYFALGIKGYRLNLKVTQSSYEFTTDDAISYYDWQIVHFVNTLETSVTPQMHAYKFYVNEAVKGTSDLYQRRYAHVMDGLNDDYMHLIGGYERGNVIRGLFMGNVWSFTMEAGVGKNAAAFASGDMATTCTGSCDLCPASPAECLGTCNWNNYWDGLYCRHCPSWCVRGCQMSGQC